MPELPEVEVAARNLRRWTVGRRVRSVEAGPSRVLRPAGPKALDGLRGARVGEVDRVGKHLLITLVRGRDPVGLWSHLGMTGKWLLLPGGQAAPRFSRVRFALDDGTLLHYADMRLFGRLRVVAGARFADVPELRALGPDPLRDGIDPARFHERLARLRVPVKVALLDQSLVAGVGNIQASESLWRARIDPRRLSKSVSRTEAARLARAILASINYTLAQFHEEGADSGAGEIVYVEENASANPFRVYARAGERCPRRDGGVITRIVQAGRATFYCPNCQK
jgi:formamidopyrimidine-DNA glycosylase